MTMIDLLKMYLQGEEPCNVTVGLINGQEFTLLESCDSAEVSFYDREGVLVAMMSTNIDGSRTQVIIRYDAIVSIKV